MQTDKLKNVSSTIGNAVLPAVLRLPLIKHWFDMTKAGIKTEDYRETSEYWMKRLFTKSTFEMYEQAKYSGGNEFENGTFHIDFADYKPFDYNIMTLGYPSKDDTSRIIKLEHKGIEVRKGKPEWGAEPNKLYFVILHGAVIA